MLREPSSSDDDDADEDWEPGEDAERGAAAAPDDADEGEDADNDDPASVCMDVAAEAGDEHDEDEDDTDWQPDEVVLRTPAAPSAVAVADALAGTKSVERSQQLPARLAGSPHPPGDDGMPAGAPSSLAGDSIPTGPRGAIAKRTRAHFSLADRDLEELEEALNAVSPAPSPPRRAVTKEGDELEWRRFLVQVHADVRSPGGSGEEDSDDDRDYSYQEDPTSRRQPEEEWESGRHFTIPLDEVKDLVTESTTGRRSERQTLQARQQAQQRAVASADEAGPSDESPGATRGASSRRVATGVDAFADTSFVRQVQIQTHLHVQLLVQVMLLARTALEQEPAFTRVALLCYNMLAEICMHCDVTLAAKQLRCRPVYATPLHARRGDTRHDGSAAAQPPQRAPFSVLCVPGFHLLPQLLLQRSGLKPLFDAGQDAPTPGRLRPLDLAKELSEFRLDFHPEYGPARAHTNRGIWGAAEDELLALGLRRYGMERLDLVRALLLPTKTIAQLQSRVKNCTRRRAEDNPVKRLRVEMSAGEVALTAAEELMLADGVAQYGEEWGTIRAALLPHRRGQEATLQRCWEHKLRPGAASQPLPLPPPPPVHAAGRTSSTAAALDGRPGAYSQQHAAPANGDSAAGQAARADGAAALSALALTTAAAAIAPAPEAASLPTLVEERAGACDEEVLSSSED